MKRPTQDPRMMLVDDEPDILEVVTTGLNSEGFQVDAFRNPLGALSYFRLHTYNTIILDVRMPEMSGFELARRIWHEERDARICFFSAFEVYENEALRNFTGKKYCFIRKPVGINELVAHINRHLSQEAVAS